MNGIARICNAASAVASLALMASAPAEAHGLEVAPISIRLAPGQLAASLTITNSEERKVSFQIRGFSWRQEGTDEDVLEPTGDLRASPPIGTIEPGAKQVVRLILKHPPEAREGTYRILFDQLPPPSEAGVVHVLIRMSIPVFAEPKTPVSSRLAWRITEVGGRSWLIATNAGTRHLTVRDIRIQPAGGPPLQVEVKSPPHILAGASRRWAIIEKNPLALNQLVRLTAKDETGAIDERISPTAGP